jgi:hypothetical protein
MFHFRDQIGHLKLINRTHKQPTLRNNIRGRLLKQGFPPEKINWIGSITHELGASPNLPAGKSGIWIIISNM